MELIKEIQAADTYSVRHSVLRRGMPLKSCAFEGDEDTSTLHYGFFSNSALIGVASLYKKKHHFFTQENQFQLRGMAVLVHHQNFGIGKKLLNKIELFVYKNKTNSLIWFNARAVAVEFYTKMGYKVIGEVFDIPQIGKHFVMYKML